MKTILCYGDSNTYGYNPKNGLRYPEHIRWPGALRQLLGKNYRLIEEGCNGRTTVFDDPLEGWKNGLDYLKPCLNSHKPIDVFLMMLGSNDLKHCFQASEKDIANGARQLLQITKDFTLLKQGYLPKIILIAPPTLGEEIALSPFSSAFHQEAVKISKKISTEYEKLAKEMEIYFFDASQIVQPCQEDSLHLTGQSHQALAGALFDFLYGEGIC